MTITQVARLYCCFYIFFFGTRALSILKRGLYIFKRALCILKRASYSRKRAQDLLKRALYIHITNEARVYCSCLLTYNLR